MKVTCIQLCPGEWKRCGGGDWGWGGNLLLAQVVTYLVNALNVRDSFIQSVSLIFNYVYFYIVPPDFIWSPRDSVGKAG